MKRNKFVKKSHFFVSAVASYKLLSNENLKVDQKSRKWFSENEDAPLQGKIRTGEEVERGRWRLSNSWLRKIGYFLLDDLVGQALSRETKVPIKNNAIIVSKQRIRKRKRCGSKTTIIKTGNGPENVKGKKLNEQKSDERNERWGMHIKQFSSSLDVNMYNK